MLSTSAKGELRVLSAAEIAIVAGGPGTDETRVDALLDRTHMQDATPDHAIVTSQLAGHSAVFYDSNHNGLYDIVWVQKDDGSWERSTDTDSWESGSSPVETIIDYYTHHMWQPNNVGE